MQSIHEIRRNAFHHYHARAENARASAWVLAQAVERGDLGTPPDYSGSTAWAWHEGFMREASVAIELLLKAAICLRIDAGQRPPPVPLSHDIPKLWLDAGLKRPSDPDLRHQLQRVRIVLEWSGRYPTAANAEREQQDIDALFADRVGKRTGQVTTYPPAPPFNWAAFSHLWSAVQERIVLLLEASRTHA